MKSVNPYIDEFTVFIKVKIDNLKEFSKLNPLILSIEVNIKSDIIKMMIVMTIIIFIISLFIFTSILSISGLSFENSFKLSILTLMNTVNSSIYGLTDFNFNNLHFLTKYCFILFMIIGRIELLTILLILKKFLFKN